MNIERIELQPGYHISRIIKGGWHLAGGHGAVDRQNAMDDMLAFVEAGITTFDCADIYTGVEELIGLFLKQHKDAIRSGNLPEVQIHTKYVPDYDALSTLTQSETTYIINRSLKRLGVERLDLVQFAWWDYSIPGYVEAMHHLVDLQKAGKIRHIGVTNFNGERLKEIIESGVKIAGNQVQYSLLDHRVEKDLNGIAADHHIPYLCYGVIAGGFLSDKYLGVKEPQEPLENRSLTKYKLIIEEMGDYHLFQQLLTTVRTIANKYHVGIAEIAAQYILQKENVGGIIVGARNRNHLNKLGLISGIRLDEEDLMAIKAITSLAKGPSGPFYDLERDKKGKHGAIMKYNLNHQR
jgi:aryl-alcohol dehydrogenase-like predicted oxidoreductase